jgi:regulatory protein
LINDPLFKQIYRSSLRFLGIRLRSEHEMKQKIQEWFKKNDETIDEERKLAVEASVLEQLRKDRYLDDMRFAEEWIYSRMRSKPRGEVLLRMELAQKGIHRDVIDSALDNVLYKKENGYSEQDGVVEMARKVGEKYVRKLVGDDVRAFKFKLSQALARKGFDGDTIRTVVDELLDKRYNTTE